MESKIVCPHCGSKNLQWNGTKKGKQRIYCKDCKKHSIESGSLLFKKPKKEKVKKIKKVKIPQNLILEDIEKHLLEGIFQNCKDDVKWAGLALKLLERLDPKYEDSKSKNFSPDEYKKIMKELYENV